jgi:hypothetical protein
MNLQVYVYLRRYGLGNLDLRYFNTCGKPTLHDTKEPMKIFLVHTMLFVGAIWKNKSGGFLFVVSLWLLVTKEIVLTARI